MGGLHSEVKWKCLSLSCVWLSVTPGTAAHQPPLSMEFSRQEYRSGLPFPSLGDLPDPGIELRSPALQGDSLLSEPPGKPQGGCAQVICTCYAVSHEGLEHSWILEAAGSPETSPLQTPRDKGTARAQNTGRHKAISTWQLLLLCLPGCLFPEGSSGTESRNARWLSPPSALEKKKTVAAAVSCFPASLGLLSVRFL